MLTRASYSQRPKKYFEGRTILVCHLFLYLHVFVQCSTHVRVIKSLFCKSGRTLFDVSTFDNVSIDLIKLSSTQVHNCNGE